MQALSLLCILTCITDEDMSGRRGHCLYRGSFMSCVPGTLGTVNYSLLAPSSLLLGSPISTSTASSGLLPMYTGCLGLQLVRRRFMRTTFLAALWAGSSRRTRKKGQEPVKPTRKTRNGTHIGTSGGTAGRGDHIKLRAWEDHRQAVQEVLNTELRVGDPLVPPRHPRWCVIRTLPNIFRPFPFLSTLADLAVRSLCILRTTACSNPVLSHRFPATRNVSRGKARDYVSRQDAQNAKGKSFAMPSSRRSLRLCGRMGFACGRAQRGRDVLFAVARPQDRCAEHTLPLTPCPHAF